MWSKILGLWSRNRSGLSLVYRSCSNGTLLDPYPDLREFIRRTSSYATAVICPNQTARTVVSTKSWCSQKRLVGGDPGLANFKSFIISRNRTKAFLASASANFYQSRYGHTSPGNYEYTSFLVRWFCALFTKTSTDWYPQLLLRSPKSGKLTEKSDVYSFGVLLAELLTGLKPGSGMALASNEGISMILNFQVADESEMEEIETVAELASKCLSLSGRRRPTNEASFGGL
ncbi:hypothetical protein CUMW_084210 [Citrus unshiu]|nr:hypothetical protein CUMW_084210 [Citrus unshiu]